MSFLGIPNKRERRIARAEAAEAIDRHGDQAAAILLMKAQQSRSTGRRAVYKLARKIVLGRDRDGGAAQG